ncbi:hypothetical protein [Treponema sp.]|uniref:hypothetical protein n=1 Tax=Treponema sp. TaxID=166 RepID=UPI0025E1970A|nr:hypothetical protein [Treponema sp.]MCR5217818.1 hypothetical protein [Treponema sp.]
MKINFSEWEKSTKILTAIIASILLIIIFVTAFALASGKYTPGQNLRKEDPTPAQVLKRPESSKLNAFTDFGQIRVRCKSDSDNKIGALVVVSPWFSYEKKDGELFEEISNKELMLENLIADYFKDFTIEELNEKGEVLVKTELFQLINENLVLGKIRGIYFRDYRFIQ